MTATRRTGLPPIATLAVAAAVAAGIVLRFTARSELWLDEALSVNIARVPLSDLVETLRQDGAPPLYYALLHGWMEIFGEGNLATRSLAGVFSVASLPLAWAAGRRLGGRDIAVASLVLAATSPFMILYATEARMYSLVMLLVLAGYLAIQRAFDRPTVGRLALVGLFSGLLALTHYWSFYLLAAVVLTLFVYARKRPDRRVPSFRVIAGIASGAILFLPWLPHFLHQSANTGTPWGTPPGPIQVAVTTLVDFGGGPFHENRVLSAVLAILVAMAVFGRATDRHKIELDLRTRPGVRVEALISVLTLLIAVVGMYASNSAYASRYTAVMYPLFLIVAAFGIRAFADRRVQAGLLAVAALAGLTHGLLRNSLGHRTQAHEIAAAIEEQGGQPGDLVAYCPDQLGPAVNRLLPDGKYQEVAFPELQRPELVNWVDYAERNRSVTARQFADRLLAAAGDKTIWYVWAPAYRTFGKRCERANSALAAARPAAKTLVESELEFFERATVTRHPPTPTPTPSP
jgi:mannosyltransferase